MIKTKTKSRTAQPLLSTWYFRASDFIRNTGSRNLWLVFGLVLLGMTITVFASLYLKSEVERAAERDFDFISSEIQLNIKDRLAASAQVLFSGAALFDSSETVTREEWRIFIEQLRIEEQLPGTQGVGFALLIPPDHLEQHIQQIRDEGFPQYAVRPEGDREAYSSIIYLEPFSGRNLRAFGYDMFSEPVRRAAMEQARDENTAVLSGKVVLVQETNEDVQAGTLVYVPVYRKGMPIETVEQRRAAIIGWVYSPYRMTDLMRGTLRNWEAEQGNQHTHLQIYDGDAISADTLLFDSRSEADKALAASPSDFSKLTPLDFEGRHWTLRFSQVGGLSTLANYDSVWFMLSGGTCFTIFLAGLVLSLLRTQVNARRIAEGLTIELKESETKFRMLAENIPNTVFLCRNDSRYTLIYLNDAVEELTGYSKAEFLENGLTFFELYHHDDLPQIPIPEGDSNSRINRSAFHITYRIHHRSGEIRWVDEWGAGVRNASGDVEYLEGIMIDITERRRAEEVIQKLNQQLNSVLDGTRDVIAMLDREFRYTLFNSAFHEEFKKIFGKDLKPGDSMLEALAGLPDDLREAMKYCERALGGEDFTVSQQFGDNGLERNWYELHVSPIHDEIGKVIGAVHIIRNITERKQMEIDLQAQRDFATQIVNVMGQGLTVTDADGRFEFVNPAYARLFGYAPADLIGKYPVDITIPDDHALLAEQRRLRQNGQSTTYESRIRRVDGSIAHVLITAVPRSLDPGGKFYGAIAVITDLTEQKQIENKLRESEERFRSFLEEVKLISVQGYGPDGTTQYWNQASERLYGYSSQEAIGKNMLNLIIPPEMRADVRQAMQQMAETGEPIPPSDLLLMRKDGSRVMVFSSHAIVQIPGREQELFCIDIDITERKAGEEKIRSLNAELEQLAGTDGLTGINNHRSLLKLAEREFDVAMRYQPPLSMLFFDIDHFKQVNDTFGHAVGDEALKLTIQTVCAKLRSADLIGRYGGDEFVILLPQTSAQDSLPLAERIHASIADMRLDTDKGSLSLTISIGIAQSIHDASQPDTVESLLLRADQALYAAKQGGRNRTVIFDERSP